jgi:hypothetical protein
VRAKSSSTEQHIGQGGWWHTAWVIDECKEAHRDDGTNAAAAPPLGDRRQQWPSVIDSGCIEGKQAV